MKQKLLREFIRCVLLDESNTSFNIYSGNVKGNSPFDVVDGVVTFYPDEHHSVDADDKYPRQSTGPFDSWKHAARSFNNAKPVH